jgi:GIY-YIG catalytic domain-containing protein
MTPPPSPAAKRWYRVYVIELDDPRPRPNPDLPWVYVGYTAKTRRERFKVHREGGRNASKAVTRYWVRLRPDLYRHVRGLRSRDDALRAERKLRQELLDSGYNVRGGEPGPFDSDVVDGPRSPLPGARQAAAHG